MELAFFDVAKQVEDDMPEEQHIACNSHSREHNLAQERMRLGSLSFFGESSNVQTLAKESSQSRRDGGGHQNSQLPKAHDVWSRHFTEHDEGAVCTDKVAPFQLPVRSTADTLVDGYFSTVHVTFPILNQEEFMSQYNRIVAVRDAVVAVEDRAFFIALQFVLAIGAVHASLSNIIDTSDERDHLLYSTRARILALDNGVFNDQPDLGKVQVLGLGAVYCLVTDQMDRYLKLDLTFVIGALLTLDVEPETPLALQYALLDPLEGSSKARYSQPSAHNKHVKGRSGLRCSR